MINTNICPTNHILQTTSTDNFRIGNKRAAPVSMSTPATSRINDIDNVAKTQQLRTMSTINPPSSIPINNTLTVIDNLHKPRLSTSARGEGFSPLQRHSIVATVDMSNRDTKKKSALMSFIAMSVNAMSEISEQVVSAQDVH
jgi:hypothetical protein